VLSEYVAASLISPKELQEPLKRVLDDVTNIRKEVQNYANLDSPSQNALIEFQKHFPALQAMLAEHYHELFECQIYFFEGTLFKFIVNSGVLVFKVIALAAHNP
jgi:hypothetical protein